MVLQLLYQRIRLAYRSKGTYSGSCIFARNSDSSGIRRQDSSSCFLPHAAYDTLQAGVSKNERPYIDPRIMGLVLQRRAGNALPIYRNSQMDSQSVSADV